MKKGQTTLEYAYIIGIAAAAIVTILVYISRGFQGNIRDKADQINAGQYEPGKTTVNNTETKRLISTSISKSSTTTTYGNVQTGSKEMRENQKKQEELRIVLKTLDEIKGDLTVDLVAMQAAQARGGASSSTALEDIRQTVEELNAEYKTLCDEYETAMNLLIANESEQEQLRQLIADHEIEKTACGSDTECVDAIDSEIAGYNTDLEALETEHISLETAKEAKEQARDDKNAEIQAYASSLGGATGGTSTPDPKIANSITDLESALETINQQIDDKTKELIDKIAAYEILAKDWQPNPDVTTITSTNTEVGTLDTSKGTSEALGALR